MSLTCCYGMVRWVFLVAFEWNAKRERATATTRSFFCLRQGIHKLTGDTFYETIGFESNINGAI